jgi:hypothetical protein
MTVRDRQSQATEAPAEDAAPEEVAQDSGESGRGQHSPAAAAPPTDSPPGPVETTQDLTVGVQTSPSSTEQRRLAGRQAVTMTLRRR